TQDLCWSIDPGDLALETYFGPKKLHLDGEFKVSDLKPVLREKGSPYRFMLKDEKDRWCMYDERNGYL
ncbi:hypothetical protein EK21DRAFT_55514, partial [Setomelanomma holmii]